MASRIIRPIKFIKYFFILPFIFQYTYLIGQKIAAQTLQSAQDSFEKYLYIDIDKAADFSKIYDSLANLKDSLFYKGEAYNLKGKMENFKGNADNASKYFYEALKIFEKIKDQKKVGVIYLNLGVAANIRQDINATLEYYYKAEQIFEDIKDTVNLSKVLYNISTQKNAQEKYDEDISLKLKVLELLKIKPNFILEATIKPNLAHSYYKNGDVGKALILIEEFLNNKEYENLKSLKSNALITYSFILQSKNQVDKAIIAAKQSLILSNENGFKDKIIKGHYQLYILYKLKNNNTEALKQFEIYNKLYEEEFNESKEETIKELGVKYESEKKDADIVLLNAENKVKSLQIKQSNNVKWALIFGLALVSLLAFLAWRLKNIKAKNNIELGSKNKIITKALEEKNILLREIHHRVKNNLQVISSLLKLQSQYIEDEGAVKAIAEGRNRVHSMALLHQNLYKEDNLTGVDMKEYFTNLIEGLFDAYNINDDDIKLQTEIEDLTLDIDTVIPLGLITNELVSNALKHAFEDKNNALLIVKLWEKDDRLMLQVKDNGKGYNPENVAEGRKSFGQKLIKSLSDKLEAEILVDTDSGAEITLSIKDYKKAS